MFGLFLYIFIIVNYIHLIYLLNKLLNFMIAVSFPLPTCFHFPVSLMLFFLYIVYRKAAALYTRIRTGMLSVRRSQWPRGLKCRSAAARPLRSWVRIPPETWIFVCCQYCVLSGRGLCDELITRPEESYRLCCVVVCDLTTSCMRRPWPASGCSAKKKMLSIWTT
jgi:hypothetical protein